MSKLYLIERTDPNNELCWGQNLSLVVNVRTRGEAEALAFEHLVSDTGNGINVMHNGKRLTKQYLKYTELGVALPQVPLGVVHLSSAST